MTVLAMQAYKNKPGKFSSLFSERMKEKSKGIISLFKQEVISKFADPSYEPLVAIIGEDYEEYNTYWVDIEEDEDIDEKKIVTKVSASGKKVKKVVCGKGFKLKGGACVPQSGTEKLSRKKGSKKASRKKKANVAGQKRALKKRAKALKKRKGFGL